jgi:hypothetical protein
MKKLKRFFGVLLLGLIVLVIGGRLGVGMMWKSALEKYGAEIAEVPVTVGSVWISPFAGKIHIESLSIGNPDGFKTSQAVSVERVDLQVEWRSLFREKTVIRELSLSGVEVTYERALLSSNLGVLSKTVQSKTKSKEALVGRLKKRVQADEVRVEGGKVKLTATLLGGRGIGVALPPLRLQNLGRDEQGITVVQLASEILKSLLENVVNLSSSPDSLNG